MRFARSLVTVTIFRICQVECRRVFYLIVLSVCGLDVSPIYGAWFRVLVIGLHWRFGSGVGLRVRSLCWRLQLVRGSEFLSLFYTGGSGWVVCPVASRL